MIVSLGRARRILGEVANEMSDQEIVELVGNLDAIAIDALRQARKKRTVEDAMATAELVYDIYQDEKSYPDNRDKKE